MSRKTTSYRLIFLVPGLAIQHRNPNVGKSSVFNWLTGMGVMTANYPGKTVEVNLATARFKDQEIGIMDLPGTYALGSTLEDQWVARQALLDAKPHAVLVVVDATNLERNLYLPLQLLDMGLPLVVALNLVDEALRNGLRIDHVKLAKFLGVPVVPTVAIRGQGLDRLVEMGLQAARLGFSRASTPQYGKDVEEAIGELADLLTKEGVILPWGLPPRATAILLLEEDEEVLAWARALPGGERILAKVREVASGIAERHGEPTLRAPSFPKMLKRTWYRFKDFLFVATPVVLIGSFIMGLIYETGLLWAFTVPLQPVVEGWLGLPAVAGLTLIFAVLRKELALQLLVALAMAKYGSGVTDLLQFMDRGQIFTYALVNTLYIPCIATIAVLAKELGWRRALLISAFTILLALLTGGIVHRLLIV